MVVRRRHIRGVAERLLAKNGVPDAPVRVENIAFGLGLTIRRQLAPPELSGFLLRDPGRRSTIGVNKRHSGTRQRFTIAHEIGHYLLHEGDVLHVDRDRIFKVNLRDDVAQQGVDLVEIEANLFAAELLMPVALLSADLESHADGLSDDDLKELAKRYQVSPQALGFRLTYLGLIQH